MGLLDDIKDKAGELGAKAKHVAEDLGEKAKDVAEDLGDKAKEGLETAKDKSGDLIADVKDRFDGDATPTETVGTHPVETADLAPGEPVTPDSDITRDRYDEVLDAAQDRADAVKTQTED